MSLKKAEKPQDVLYIKVASINTESQKTPAECRIQQLESLILQLPSAAYAAQTNPNMLAKNILPLLRPIDVLLQKWGITAIGAVGAQVAYDPQKHEFIDGNDQSDQIEEGDMAIVRYVGYMQNEKLLYRARVSS